VVCNPFRVGPLYPCHPGALPPSIEFVPFGEKSVNENWLWWDRRQSGYIRGLKRVALAAIGLVKLRRIK